ncbi:hypothetical protein [Actinacidiphila sp. ITFR-21]|uniref:hypothetical protein n=1 Tax=Actinacidiphila sp. ITFR-21 TaxID=3075199 RepID=UPI00288AFA7D|nr:hypothetical protein [Streptomyces sp. ITFR-21]WNI15546.1 hypothetical protein RLT57_08420 [Streptomyces sp. ITFR-21]
MSARDGLLRHLTGQSLCPPPRPAEEATGLLAEAADELENLLAEHESGNAPEIVFQRAVAGLYRQWRDEAGKDAREGESIEVTPDFFQPGRETRAAAREALRGLTGGDAAPRWRVVWTDDEYPTDIGPVCGDPDHEPTDGSAYSCCPEPIIEIGDEALAAYLVALLNQDRTPPDGPVQYGIRHGNGEVQPVGGDRQYAAGTRARMRATTDPDAVLVQRTITPGRWTLVGSEAPRD